MQGKSFYCLLSVIESVSLLNRSQDRSCCRHCPRLNGAPPPFLTYLCPYELTRKYSVKVKSLFVETKPVILFLFECVFEIMSVCSRGKALSNEDQGFLGSVLTLLKAWSQNLAILWRSKLQVLHGVAYF
jgi:hypothetical protein